MNPSLKSLQAFEAVARNNSFTKAAAELHVTQSAVSHQVTHLEQYIGVDLLIREGRSFVLTEAGKTLSIGLNSALSQIKRSVADVTAAGGSGPLGVSMRPHFASKWLAPRLAKFWGLHPGFDIRFNHTNLAADFSDPSLHLSIEWLTEDQASSRYIKLVDGDLTPACSPKYIKMHHISQPSDLTGTKLLHESDESAWLAWLERAGVEDVVPESSLIYEDTNVRQEAAMEDQGVALICPQLAEDDIRAGRLVCPFSISLSRYAYYLVLPENRAVNKKAQIFIDWLLSNCK